MNSKNLVLCTVFLLLFAFYASGQKQQPSSEMRANRQTEWMTKELQLTDQQTTKVAEINLRYQLAIDEAQNTIADKTKRDANVKELHKRKIKEYQNVLTPEQLEKLKLLLKENKQNRKNP